MRTREFKGYRAEIATSGHKIILGSEPATYEGDADKCIVLYDAQGNVLFDVHADGTSTIGGGENTHAINGSDVKSVLEIHSEGGAAPAGLSVHDHGDTTALGSEITFFRSRGTHIDPTAVIDTSIIGRISAFPYDGVDHSWGGYMSFTIDGTPGENDAPTAITFANAADGANTPAERMRIKPGGEIIFTNGGGLAHGCMNGSDVASALGITASGQGNKKQVLAFAANGPSTPSIVPDHTNDHITVSATGRYEVKVAIAVASGAGVSFKGAFSVYKNNGATEFQ
jgi:hypothetical protein